MDRPFSWQVLKPVAVRGGAVLWGELYCGDGVGEGLCAGAFVCGWWGWCLGHLVVRLLWGFRFRQFCADGGETSGRVGEAGGGVAGSFQVIWYSSGFPGSCCMVMAAVASSSGVHRCGLWSRWWTVMVWRCSQLWNARRAWRPFPGVPWRAGVGLGCRFQERVHAAFPGVFPEKVFLHAPLVVAPFLVLPPLEGRVVRWEVSLDGLVVLLGVHGVG